jgi:hypothetical protein
MPSYAAYIIRCACKMQPHIFIYSVQREPSPDCWSSLAAASVDVRARNNELSNIVFVCSWQLQNSQAGPAPVASSAPVASWQPAGDACCSEAEKACTAGRRPKRRQRAPSARDGAPMAGVATQQTSTTSTHDGNLHVIVGPASTMAALLP